MKRLLPFLLFLFALPVIAQVHTFPAEDTNNVFTGTNQFMVGHKDGPVTFSSLPAESNGTQIYCSDCQQVTPCAAGGSGAVAQGINSVWACTSGNGSTAVGGVSGNAQYNNNGVLGGVPNVTAASPLVSQGPNAPTYAQGITYATAVLNWSQASTTALTAATPATVTLTPCPIGVDTTSGVGYDVYINDGSAEVVNVTGGTCTSGASSGTIAFTPFASHSSYTLGSASSGIQETINTACGVSATPSQNGFCNVTIPGIGGSAHSNPIYNVYGTIFLHGAQSVLSGYGSSLACIGRGPCLQIGDQSNANHSPNNTVQGVNFRTNVDYSGNVSYTGLAITNTATVSSVQTITTSGNHGFRIGDMVTILFTDDSNYWGDCVVQSVPSSNTFTCLGSGNITSASTPGIVALSYEAVLDNGNGSHFIDVNYDYGGDTGHFNNFFDFWDDENATITHFNNNSINLNRGANWTGSYIFSAHPHVSQQTAPVITLRDSNITAGAANCVTDYNSNGLYIDNTVCQSTGLWEIYSSNVLGNFQGATAKDLYNNGSNAGLNPISPVHTPFPGLGGAGLIAGNSTSAASFNVKGNGGVTGYFPTGGAGATPYTYYIVVNDVTSSTQTSPMQILNWESTGSDSIPVSWPRVANGADTITYDVIRMTTPAGPNNPALPYPGGTCGGGSGGTCGSVATAISQATACSGTLICTYTDTGSGSTSSYSIKEGNLFNNGTATLHPIFWPGAIVATNLSVNVDTEQSPVVGIGLNGNPLQIVQYCMSYGATSPGGYSSCTASQTSINNAVPNQTATLMTDGSNTGASMSLSKGRLIFGQSPYATGLYAHHVITVNDSQPGLTRTTPTFRAAASANDVWIGLDVASNTSINNARLAFGAPVSITNYIAATGDGSTANWGERLTSSLKEFKVQVKLDAGITGLALRCETGLGDGLNAMSAGTYLQSFCYNDSGVTWTITGIKCFTDNSGSSTLNASGHTLGALLTGAITCSSAFAAGTQTANVLLTAGDYIAFTFVADGTSKQSTWVVSVTQ